MERDWAGQARTVGSPAEVEEASGSDFDDQEPCCITVRVSGPGHVARLLKTDLARPGRIARLTCAHWRAMEGRAPSEREVESALASMDTKLCFSVNFTTEQGGYFQNMTEEQLRDTFLSFPGAIVVSVEDTARLDASAWRGLTEALPSYHKMQCLELQRTPIAPTQLEALLKAASRCPALEKLHLQVDADGFGRGPEAPWFPQLRELALEQGTTGCMDVLVRAEDWLPRMPKLRKLDFWLSARSQVQTIFDGLKRGVLAGIRQHGMLSLRECEATVFFYRHAMPEGEVRCDLLDPSFPCAFRMRDEDYAHAWELASIEPPYSLDPEEESWRTTRISFSVFAALRRRQWERHLVLSTFLGKGSEMDGVWCKAGRVRGEHCATHAVMRRLAALPRDLWCMVLEWWLGGRIFIGERVEVTRKRRRPLRDADEAVGEKRRHRLLLA